MEELRALVGKEGKVLTTARTELNSWGNDTNITYDNIPGFKHKMKRLVDKRKSRNLNQDSDNSGDNDNEDF